MKPLPGVACTPVTPVTPSSRKIGREQLTISSPTVYSIEWVAIRLWLASIGEQNPAVIEEIASRCEADEKVLVYCLEQARTMAVSLNVGTVMQAGAVPSIGNSVLGLAEASTERIAVEQAVATVALANQAAKVARAFNSLKKIHAEHLGRLDGRGIARVLLSDSQRTLLLTNTEFHEVVNALESSGQIICEHGYVRPSEQSSESVVQ